MAGKWRRLSGLGPKSRASGIIQVGFVFLTNTRDRHNMRDPREHRLIEQLRTGDQLAVAELASTYGTKIYQLALRYMKNREDAEEVAQDVLLKVVRKIDAFRGDAALSVWISRITFNTAMSRLRTLRFSRPAEVPERLAARPEGDDQQTQRRADVVDW